ncbi:DUF4912 domain-containing protein [Synechococcus sp. CS-1331]|uniref:DUF4912 domain-containing protein n=1 Tax=Synechococcus sp. CS-1331 TaxID=2847973 RepID=UPI00223AC8CB|nr:DUF4912 domain-containing protein [Synechococcus sp. CS-1331]
MTSGFPLSNQNEADGFDIGQLSLRQLRQMASDLGIGRYSRMLKDQLLSAIQRRSDAGADSQDQPEQLRSIEAEMVPAPRPELQTTVVFLPRDPQWAYVFWELSDVDRRQAMADGSTQLVLRVADVTGLGGGAAHQHTLMEVVVNSHATEWYLPVPLSDRDYRVELGYRVASSSWRSLAFSGVARVPALHPSEQVLDQFVPFSLDAMAPVSDENFSVPAATAGIHERIYQVATSTSRTLGMGRGSEAFHTTDSFSLNDQGLHASGVGRWASGRSESGAGLVASRPRSFWLVADAELVVYGATDPDATLRIGEEIVPLAEDGTFRIQVPFRDGQQLYPITAVAEDGEQTRHITLNFNRTTPEANVNTAEEAELAEWF